LSVRRWKEDIESAPPGEFSATDQAEALSVRLARRTALIHNPTEGAAKDFGESTMDRTWHPPLPQTNKTTREITYYLREQCRKDNEVSIVSHSQGCLLVRNALLTLRFVSGGEIWLQTKVRWVACAVPFRDEEFPAVINKFTILNNSQDPINVVARFEKTNSVGFDSKSGINIARHDFVKCYTYQIREDMLWECPNVEVRRAQIKASDLDKKYRRHVFIEEPTTNECAAIPLPKP
jgi:hypothetical protein